MRAGRTNSDFMMLVLPVAVSFGLVIVMSGGAEEFMTLADVALRDVFGALFSWVQSR
jgi:hypothetical protein